MEEDVQAILEAGNYKVLSLAEFTSDYDMGLLLKTQIIPNAVLWYTGKEDPSFVWLKCTL
jgi:hypothetical protein